jgi:hypothetical protein
MVTTAPCAGQSAGHATDVRQLLWHLLLLFVVVLGISWLCPCVFISAWGIAQPICLRSVVFYFPRCGCSWARAAGLQAGTNSPCAAAQLQVPAVGMWVGSMGLVVLGLVPWSGICWHAMGRCKYQMVSRSKQPSDTWCLGPDTIWWWQLPLLRLTALDVHIKCCSSPEVPCYDITHVCDWDVSLCGRCSDVCASPKAGLPAVCL